MRIAIINLTGGGVSGGYRYYLQSILPLLAKNDSITAILCASPAAFAAGGWMPALPKTSYAECEAFSPLRSNPGPKLKLALDRFRPDIIFIPVERPLKYGRIPIVCMIQNMAPLTPHGRYPISESLKMLVQRFMAWRAVKRANHVIAMSRFVKDFLHNFWAVPHSKVSLVYFGSPTPGREARRPVNVPLDWDGKYFFSAGSLEPYRGVEDALKAISSLKKAGREGKLIIAGTARRIVCGYEERMRRLAEDEGIADDVIWLGQITGAEMNWCYRNSRAFVMTSRVEALAVIILEALSNGCVCISADNPPFPEAFSGAALYYSAGDYSSLAAKMTEVLDADKVRLATWQKQSLARVKCFSWDETVFSMIKVFSGVLADK